MNKKHIKDYIAEDGGWKLDSNNAMDAWDELIERLGVDEAANALVQAMAYDDLADLLVYIFRQYDFDDSPNLENNITDSKKSVKDSVRKVSWLKNILEDSLNLVKSYPEDAIVNLQPTTYHMGNVFLGTDDGYISLFEGEIVDEEETEDELVQWIYDNFATQKDALDSIDYIKENGPQGFSTYDIKKLITQMDDWNPEMNDSKKSTKDAFEANIKKLIKEEDEAIASYEHEIENAQRPEVDKVLRHIQAEEQEHKRELESLLNRIHDDTVTITKIPKEVTERQNAKTSLVTDFIYDLLKENNIGDFTIENSDYPWVYIDFTSLQRMKIAERLLDRYFENVNSADDEGFYFITVKSTEFKGK